MAKINLHTEGREGAPVKMLALRISTDMSLQNLIDGLCSRYGRHSNHLKRPAALKEADLLEVIRMEYLCHGTQGAWEWVEDMPEEHETEYRRWAKDLIITAIPGMKEDA